MRSAALALLLATQACVFPATATGRLETHDDAVWIRATNDKTLPLVLDAASAPLAFGDGLLVELEGTYRRGAIEVGRWRVVEGPHGLQAWAGRVVRGDDGRVAIEVPENGVWRLRGPLLDDLADAMGRVVLVEGAVDGPMMIQVLDWTPLDGQP